MDLQKLKQKAAGKLPTARVFSSTPRSTIDGRENQPGSSKAINPSCARARRSVRGRYLSEPKFELDGHYDYGDYCPGKKAPGNRHFIPRRAKLKSAGGRSISLYEKWRSMQYQSNCIMKKFLDRHKCNVSVLPPCSNYDLWKNPKWKSEYDKPLDEDPCPDCDVRFFSDSDGIYHAKIAPASILYQGRWAKRQHMDTIILIGLPQHITVAYIKETSSQVYVEYVDPAGPSGDKRGCEEVQLWMHTFLAPMLGKPIKFFQAAKSVNFQSDRNDVMCQTWIWYWVYFRLIRNVEAEVMTRHIYRLSVERKSLDRVHKFNCWLADLHKLGFFTKESPSQTKIAEMSTPRRPTPAAGVNNRPSSSGSKKKSRMQSIFKKLVKKTSADCFTRTYSDSTDDEDDSSTYTTSTVSSEENFHDHMSLSSSSSSSGVLP